MTMIHIISRKNAMALGMKRYFTASACKNGHVSERLAPSGRCCECTKIWGRDSDAKRRVEPHREGYMKSYLTDYAIHNREAIKGHGIKHRAAHADKIAQAGREYRGENKERYRALCHERRAKIKARIPKWVDSQHLNKIRAMHYEAKRLEGLTGIEFHVDHIIPIAGDLVSGLHVIDNMQIITKSENLRKNNIFDPWSFRP